MLVSYSSVVPRGVRWHSSANGFLTRDSNDAIAASEQLESILLRLKRQVIGAELTEWQSKSSLDKTIHSFKRYTSLALKQRKLH